MKLNGSQCNYNNVMVLSIGDITVMSVSLSDTPLKKKYIFKNTLLTTLCLVTDKILFEENKNVFSETECDFHFPSNVTYTRTLLTRTFLLIVAR